MEKRRLGKTGHQSSVLIFGAVALAHVSPVEANAAIELVRAHGINHFDVAPSYGEAELRLGPWLAQHRSEIFLGCKTYERSKQAAHDELCRSLERLHVESFDLYQLHAVNEMEELDRALASNGALEAILQAREEGLLKYIGITGHGYHAPQVHAAALERFDFDTVMTPLNFVQWMDPRFRGEAQHLLELATQKDVGVMIIKTLAQGPWDDKPHNYETWYEPFDNAAAIDRGVRFVLSQRVTGFTNPGDMRLLPMTIAAAENFRALDSAEEQELLNSAVTYQPLFAPA